MTYYEKNKERVRQQHKEYYQAHREERLFYQNNYNKIIAEEKEKRRVRYWSTRDMNKCAKIPPASLSPPLISKPVSFSLTFE